MAFLKDLVTDFQEEGLQTALANKLQRLIDQEKSETELEPKAQRPRLSTDTATECTDEQERFKEVLQMKEEMSYMYLE